MSSILIRAATADGPDNVSRVKIPDDVEDDQVVSFAKEFVGLHGNVPIRNGLSAVTVIRLALGKPLHREVPECLVDKDNIPKSLRDAYLSVESDDSSLCISALIAFLSMKTGHELKRSYDTESNPGDDTVLFRILYGSLDSDVEISDVERGLK